LPFLDTFFAEYPSLHLLLAELVNDYWNDALTRLALRFSAPSVTRESLREARHLRSSARIRSVLSTVSSSLYFPLPNRVQHWLSTGEMLRT
jgi:hypothetical protein